MTERISHQYTILSDSDLQGIHDFIADAEIVEGPEELYAVVVDLWPELLHKVKPPRGAGATREGGPVPPAPRRKG